MAEIFICPRNALREATREQIRAAGVVLVETDKPDQCRFLRSNALISGDDMLVAAIRALNVTNQYGDGQQQRNEFISQLLELAEISVKRRTVEQEAE